MIRKISMNEMAKITPARISVEKIEAHFSFLYSFSLCP